MDVGSPENRLEELSDFLKEDGSTLAAELDLSFVVNKEGNAEEYVYDGLASCNEFHLDQNEQDQQAPPSLPSDLRYYEISGSASEKIHSPLQTGFDHDVFANETIFVGDQERFQSPSRNNHHQEETEMPSGSYPFKSSIQVETENFHHEIEAEVAANLQEFPLIEEANQEEEMEDRLASPPHDETVEETFLETSIHELTKSEFAYKEVEDEVSDIQAEKLYSSPSSNYGNNESKSENIICSRNSPAESRKLEMLHSDHRNLESTPQLSKSPGTVRQVAVSPDLSPGAYPSPSSQKMLASPERSDQGKEASKDNSFRAGRQNPASPQRIRHRSHHMDGSSVERGFPSPRNHDSHQRHRRRDRSVSLSLSRSPVRGRGSSSRHKRDHHNRSRSRSPYKRDHHRRSPRRRYSPRRRSPPSGYHSYRRSPNRRPWAPPHNRSTGLGKPGRNLFVAGFSFLTTERDLERKFSRYGRVRDVRIVRDKRSGDSRGFGFLSLERDAEADAAIRALDKTEWNGRIVLVEKSKSH